MNENELNENSEIQQSENLDPVNEQDPVKMSDSQQDDLNSQEPPTNKDFGSPEEFNYSAVELPEGIVLDQELVNEFNPIAKKLNLSQQSADELMKLAVKLTSKQIDNAKNLAVELKEAEKNSYVKMLHEDKELNVADESKYNQYLSTANIGVKAVATDGFKQLLKDTGLSHHPEFIKTFHKIGLLCSESKIPDVKVPASKADDPAEILYGKS